MGRIADMLQSKNDANDPTRTLQMPKSKGPGLGLLAIAFSMNFGLRRQRKVTFMSGAAQQGQLVGGRMNRANMIFRLALVVLAIATPAFSQDAAKPSRDEFFLAGPIQQSRSGHAT